jgi:hypothetical protein
VAATVESAIPAKVAINEKLARRTSPGGLIVFSLILDAGMFYVASHLASDLSVEHAIPGTEIPNHRQRRGLGSSR